MPSSRVKRLLRLPLLVFVLAAGIWCLPRVAPLAEASRGRFVVDPMHVDLAAAPPWFGGAIEARLRESLRELAPAPLGSDEDVVALVRGLAGASGWIRSIERVEKRYPNRLEVELVLRRPAALVEADAELFLVDEEGVVVAPAAEAAAFLEEHELPLVHGPRPLGALAAGERASAPWLEEGLRVAAELAPHRASLADRGLAIAVIDASAQSRAGGRALTDVELCTSDGLVIEWGRSSSHPRFGPLEPPPDAKIRGLLRIAARHPDLAGIRRVRLQFHEPYVVLSDAAPLAAAP